MRLWLSALLVFICWNSAAAWNDKGHMVIARLAWKELTPAERVKVLHILKRHPHFHEFLKEKVPAGIAEEEWVFLRASTWPDWVRSGPSDRRQYHMSQAHYINLPLVTPGSVVQPPAKIPEQNVVTQIDISRLMVKRGNQEDRAVHLCWVMHLVGDIHQPLHCVALYNNDFPKGDRGGNLAKVRIDGKGIIQMHSFWDGLLGGGTSLQSLASSQLEIEQMVAANPQIIAENLAKHHKPEEWAREGHEIAKKYVYLDLSVRPANDDTKPASESIPVVPADYGTKSGEVARYCVAKAGKRLATMLKELIKE